MEEIAQQFREELQKIIDRYKTRLSVPRIMHVAQGVFHKTLSVKYHPELHSKEIAEAWLDERYLKDMGVRKPCKLESHVKKLILLDLNRVTNSYSNQKKSSKTYFNIYQKKTLKVFMRLLKPLSSS